ncbi:MAG: hypothetical protein KDD51_10050 [Bdellovibrionales bacterium]|nr:hypothetical protein [Bdellovibrionales bacterium]
MDSWKLKRYARTGLTWALIVFAGWSGYRLFDEGAFRSVPSAVARVYGKFPVIGKPIRQWAYGRSYGRGRKYYRRGRSGVSRRYRGRRSRRR